MSINTDTRGQAFALTVDGVNHTMVLPLTIKDSIRLRTEVGWSHLQLLEFLKNPDLDTLAVCVWIARIQAGETVSFDAVAETVSYASDFSIGALEVDHPEV